MQKHTEGRPPEFTAVPATPEAVTCCWAMMGHPSEKLVICVRTAQVTPEELEEGQYRLEEYRKLCAKLKSEGQVRP